MGLRPVTPGAVEADIAAIINSPGVSPEAIKYNIILHSTSDDIPITQPVAIEVSRDYANNITDYILVTFLMPLGTYVKRVHPNQDNLEMSINMSYYGTSYPVKYKMVISVAPSNIAGTIYSSYTEDELNEMEMVTVEVQCLSRLVESLRIAPVAGVHHYASVSKTIKSVICEAIKNIKIEGSSPDYNFNMVKANNDKVYRHIMLPTGMRALDIPTFIQSTEYGVYSSDIGVYVQKTGYYVDNKKPKESIFVYPLYNHLIADEPGPKLMILSSPTILLSRVEKSYLIDGDVIKIIGSGDMRSQDTSQSRIMSKGSSIVRANTDSIITSGNTVTDDTINASNSKNVTGDNLTKRRDGLSGTRYAGASSNIYKQYSDVSKDALGLYQVTWNYSNPELLIPGMPVIYVYEDKDHGVIRLRGVVHSHYTKYTFAYKTHSTFINVLLEPYIDGIEKGKDSVDVRY